MTITIILTLLVIYLVVRCVSLEFRHSYLKQKCLNRMSKPEIEVMLVTDYDFWSFLKSPGHF